MILQNVRISGNSHNSNIHIEQGIIQSVADVRNVANAVRFDHAIAFPGLINSHDHLDFNSFPPLGNAIYDNYVTWGDDIHLQNKTEIEAVLKIPKALRVQWSLYKNLLNGITTVVQHGENFPVSNTLVDVFQDCHAIHSVRLEKRWKLKLNKPRKDDWPIVIHIGEGTDADAAKEINELIRWNLLRKKLIGIHGVAMNKEQAKHFNALVWSPDSNYFLLDKTADIPALKPIVPILFGTDATLTGSWSIWKQLRIAANTKMASAQDLYDMLTATPAKIWGFKHKGYLSKGAVADIVIAENKDNTDFDTTFINTNPENILLVMHHGYIRLFDESMHHQLNSLQYDLRAFTRIKVNGRVKYVFGNLAELMQQIRNYNPGIVFPDISTF